MHLSITSTINRQKNSNTIENLKYIFTVDGNYTKNLRDSIISFTYSFPIIVIISLIFAVILTQKFKGRIFARAVFFLPVIIATGVVMELMNGSGTGQPEMMSVTGSGNSYTSGMIDASALLEQIGLSSSLVEFMSNYISQIFDLIWSIGIQVILFVSGLQTIPEQLYEVSKVEGASKWEEFWFITVPMLRNVILLVMMFTMVDLFLKNDNLVINQAYQLISGQNYGLGAAMLWCYFAIVLALSGLLLYLYFAFCKKKWE